HFFLLKPDGPRVRHEEADHEAKQRGLPAAARANQDRGLPRRNRQVRSRQDLDCAKRFGNVDQLKHGFPSVETWRHDRKRQAEELRTRQKEQDVRGSLSGTVLFFFMILALSFGGSTRLTLYVPVSLPAARQWTKPSWVNLAHALHRSPLTEFSLHGKV